MRKLVESGADPNAAADGSPILSEAIWRGEVEILEILIEAGADPNAPLDYGSHLYNAIRMEYTDSEVRLKTVRTLVDAGADVNWTNNPGYPETLNAAVITGDPEVVRVLVEAGADPHTEPGRVPILSKATDKEIVRLLVEAGAPTEGSEHIVAAVAGSATGAEKNEALVRAAAHGEIDTMRMLVDNGADVNASDADGITVLQWALGLAREGESAEVARFLIEAGADVNATNKERLYRPAQRCRQGDTRRRSASW